MKILAVLLGLSLCASSAFAANCVVSGVVYDPVGKPLPNATINFDSLINQNNYGTVVKPAKKTTTTDPNGNLRPINLPQGVIMQGTICNTMGGCGASFMVVVPNSPTVDWNQL